MNVRRALASGMAALMLATVGPAGVAPTIAVGSASLSITAVVKYKNCARLNAVYRHGVGRPGARDKVRAGTQPVTNFTRNLALYNANKGRDRDGDGIACEKL